MRYRILIGSGFVVGFVTGAWIGRDRYDGLMRRVRGMTDNPSVHATAGLLHAQAAGAVETAKRAVTGAATGPSEGAPGTAPPPVPYGLANGARPDRGKPTS